jgi:hypothetical protein
MRRRGLLLVLTIAAVPAMGARSAAAAAHATDAEVDALASAVMAKLTAGKPGAAVARIHEPRAWDGQRAADDRQKVSAHLATLLKEFGKISGARPAGAVAFYEIQNTGADVPYWQSLPRLGIDSSVVYAVKFSNVGPGIVSLTFTRVSGSWELRSVALGLDRSRPESKATMMRIGRIFLESLGLGMSKQEIDMALANMLGLQPT